MLAVDVISFISDITKERNVQITFEHIDGGYRVAAVNNCGNSVSMWSKNLPEAIIRLIAYLDFDRGFGNDQRSSVEKKGGGLD